MEPQFKTSFIPKKPISVEARPGIIRTKRGFSFFTLLATILFLATIIFAAGVTFFRSQMQRKIDDQVASLEIVRNQFDKKFIAEATRLSDRISVANKILENHVAPSEIFELFQDYTLKTVKFNSFSFSEAENGLAVSADGVAKGFGSIVLQSDEFNASGVMWDVLFENVQLQEDETVTFSFSGVIDPTFILYRKDIVEIIDDQPPAVEPVEEDDLGDFAN